MWNKTRQYLWMLIVVVQSRRRPYNSQSVCLNESKDKIFMYVWLKPMDEQNLSQQMSQLSTDVTVNKECLLPKIKFDMERIPDYLTKHNTSFKKMLIQAVSVATASPGADHSPTIDELRKIALVIYRIMTIQTYRLLWTAYLLSGTGQLITPSTTKPAYSTTAAIWPKEIKTATKTDENDPCLKLVNDHLQALDDQFKKSQIDLNLKANDFPGYSLPMQKIMEAYIEQNLSSFQREIEHQVELVHYDYHIQGLKLGYLQQNPNNYQVGLLQKELSCRAIEYFRYNWWKNFVKVVMSEKQQSRNIISWNDRLLIITLPVNRLNVHPSLIVHWLIPLKIQLFVKKYSGSTKTLPNNRERLYLMFI